MPSHSWARSPRMVSSNGRSLYREPLRPRVGVTSARHGIRTPVSPGVTPAFSLIRAHAPDLSPLSASVRPLYRESWQVAACPCWKEALPGVISANRSPGAWTHTPVAPVVHMLVSSHRASAFPPSSQGRRRTTSRTTTSVRGSGFGAAAIHSCSGPRVCSPPRSFPPLGRASQPRPGRP